MQIILSALLLSLCFSIYAKEATLKADFFGEKISFMLGYETIDNEKSFPKDFKSLVPRTMEEVKELSSQLRAFAKSRNLDDFGMLLLNLSLVNSIPSDKSKALRSLPEVLSKNSSNHNTSVMLLSALLWSSGIENIILKAGNFSAIGIPIEGGSETQGFFIEEKGKRYFVKDLSMHPPGFVENPDKLNEGFVIVSFNLKGRPLNLEFKNGLPKLKQGSKLKRKFGFTFRDKFFRVETELDSNLTEYSNRLPVDFLVKTRFGALELERLGLSGRLKEIITREKFSGVDAVNFLLAMLSQLFRYRESDIEGASKTLIELANDCDARSVFFASLLLSVLNYSYDDIVFLEFPGEKHATAAVNIKLTHPAEMEGTYISHKGKQYWVCDTTYLVDGIAKAGLLHPDYSGKKSILRELK